jgi:hypothetical protein
LSAGPQSGKVFIMSLKTFFLGRMSSADARAEKAPARRSPVRNANVAALNKHVNESDRYSVDAVHKAFGEAMSQAKAKAKD